MSEVAFSHLFHGSSARAFVDIDFVPDLREASI